MALKLQGTGAEDSLEVFRGFGGFLSPRKWESCEQRGRWGEEKEHDRQKDRERERERERGREKESQSIC